jgi:hypothetical protein
MQIDLWHGTNQDFDTFDERYLGLHTANNASRCAFFFAANVDTARDYAQGAARNLVPNQIEHEAHIGRILDDAEAARRAGRMNRYEELLVEAEDIEFAAIQAEPAGARILKCRVSFENPYEIDGAHHSVLTNLGDVLEVARVSGHDAVILRGINDTPSGTVGPDDHYAVFSSAQIEIIDMINADPMLDLSRENHQEDMLDMEM